MVKPFYLKLAAGNLTRSRRMYGPYCVASALMSGMFFIILNLVFSRSVANLSYGGTVQAMFTIGIVVMTLFTIGYMLYINAFLIKRRKKEFGLYGVLGMEKRHVARVILWENALLSFGSLLLGMVFGVIFGRLAFLLLMHVLDTAQGSVYVLSGSAVALTVAIFTAIFVLTTLYNLNQVRLATPIDLLKGGQKGEKRVRFPALLTFLGLAMLGYAYYLAITVRNSAVALLGFWPAVILVILATWLLFTGGSVFVLQRLKNNKRIYYKPRNFIAISSLIYRMKQNAAGLANICILSTMVMVTVSCCCSLYIGREVILREQNRNDITMTIRLDDADAQAEVLAETRARAGDLAQEDGIAIESEMQYRYHEQNVLYIDGKLVYADEAGDLPFTVDMAPSVFYGTTIVLLEDYNRVMGARESLSPGEVLVLTESDDVNISEIPCMDGGLSVKQVIDGTPFSKGKNSAMRDRLFVVVPDMQTGERLARSMNPPLENFRMWTRLVYNVQADQEAGYAFSSALLDAFRTLSREAIEGEGISGNYLTTSIFINRLEGYGMYGGLLFLGVFFAILFLINTVLILYFKQLSEGFDDCERFAILQKIGLSDEEVKSTINRQMLIVFLLPLIVALLHIAAASNMIQMMLGTFMLTDFTLTLLCILATSAVFIVVYLIVYRMTAKEYYRLVKW